MTKEEYAALLQEVGGGDPRIGGAARKERHAAEQQALIAHEAEMWGILGGLDREGVPYRQT